MNLVYLAYIVGVFSVFSHAFDSAVPSAVPTTTTTPPPPGSSTSAPIATTNSSRGILMCTGDRQLKYIKRNLFLVRQVWGSQLPFALAHCDEISAEKQAALEEFDSNIQFLNLCETAPVFKMDLGTAKQTLRGFFCKIGALIKSPFEETMISDIDVVWFKKPDILFDAPGYIDTGSLFMRERMYVVNARSNMNPDSLLKYFQSAGVQVDKESATKHFRNNGYPSLFWRPYIHSENPAFRTQLSDFQDSSIVLVHKERHPGMISTLSHYLETGFRIGYGDKELFWISATVANEPFAFEPYIGAQYRDCYGVMFHFDPTVAPPAIPSPLYMNAEFLVERKSEPVINGYLRELEWVGEYLQNVITKPMLATEDLPFVDFDTWKHNEATGCTCLNQHADGSHKGVVDCTKPSLDMNQQLVLAQWLTFTATLEADKAVSSNCVPTLFSHIEDTNFMLKNYVNDSKYCHFAGCPKLPIEVDHSFPWATDTIGQYCDPVSFISYDDPLLAPTAAAARSHDAVLAYNRHPLKINSTVLNTGGDRSVFLLKDDGKLHFIPDVDTFFSLGLDFGDTVHLPNREFSTYELGEPIPSVDKKYLRG